jgi:hypothetical protein
MSEKFYFNTEVAFANFKRWAEYKTFNEILGCAKLGIDGLLLRKDVDEFNNNQIAFLTYYADERGNSTLVEVNFIHNEVVFFDYFGKKHKAFKDLDYEEQIKAISEYVGFDDEDRIAEEVWNEYVDNGGVDGLDKIWVRDADNVSTIINSLTEEEAKRVLASMCLDDFIHNERYFSITKDLEWESICSVWANIDLVGLWDYLNKCWHLNK